MKSKKKTETALVPTNAQAPSTEVKQTAQKDAAPVVPEQDARMTIYEYEQKYVKHQSVRGARFTVGCIAAVLGVFLFTVLALLVLRVYEFNKYAGYGAAAAAVLAYILAFIVPLVKILRTPYFITNVNAFTARKAQKHNRKVRHDIASKIIDLSVRVEGVGWYDSLTVGKLAVAMKMGSEEGIKQQLTALYKGSVKKSARTLIFKSALKSATFSAVSQSAQVDAALIVVVNLQLIKDLVFLYGFRPSEAKLVRIFGRVVQNALVAYGVGGINIGSTVVKTMGGAVKGIPILGAAISSFIDSSVQGLANGALTTVIGYQTIRYLNEEYHLQDILDGIDLADTEVEIEAACAELETELKSKKKRGGLAEAG